METSSEILLSILLFCAFLVLLFFWWKNRIGSLEPPVPRSYIPVSQANPNLPKLKVCSYNLLADNVAFRIITHTPYKYLHFKYRSARIIQEIDHFRPDILCLQEVDHFKDFYRPELEKIGYSAYLNKRKRCCRHGAAIGFLKARFSLLELGNVDFNDVDPNDSFYRTNSAALICLLKDNRTGTLVIVSSVHTWFMNQTVIYAQVAFLLYKIEHFVSKHKGQYPGLDIQTTPIIIGGDFNASPQREPIRYMRNLAPVRENNNDANDQRMQRIWSIFPNNFKLRSAYESYKSFAPNQGQDSGDQHPDYTLVKTFFKRKLAAYLDYLWYNPSAVEVLGLLEIPSEEEIARNGEPGMPNSLFSSDHLRVEAEFGLKIR